MLALACHTTATKAGGLRMRVKCFLPDTLAFLATIADNTHEHRAAEYIRRKELTSFL